MPAIFARNKKKIALMKRTFYKLATCCVVYVAMAMGAEAQTISTICGDYSGFAGDGGAASAARLSRPGTVRHDQAGNIYVMAAGNVRIRKISVADNNINTIIGTGLVGHSGDGGLGIYAEIDPGSTTGGDMVIDNSNNVYFSDLSNYCIRKMNTAGIVSTVAGTPTVSGTTGDGGPATAAKFLAPLSFALDAAGNMYIVDHNGCKIRKIDAATGTITTIAGNGTAASTGDGGAATAAKIDYPTGIAIDASGNLYFGEYITGVIRKITVSTGVISTFATGLYRPAMMEFDKAGSLFVGSFGPQVRRVSSSGVVAVVAGSGTTTSPPTGDGGPATAATLGNATGVSISPSGDLLISAGNDSRIRKVTALTATISGTASLCTGATTTLTASIPDAAWISGNTAVATVSATGVVTGVAAGTATITYVAGLVFGTRVVTVNAPVAPVVSASGATLSVAGTFATYQWSLGGAPIAGATSATYVATAPGTYAVAVTTTDGCSATSADFVLSSVSVSDVSKGNGLQVFPNPATDGRFAISVAGAQHETITIVITNAVGAKVFESKIAANKMTALKLDVPTGVYMLQAATAAGNYHSKIMVK
jgi:hypothetical protein